VARSPCREKNSMDSRNPPKMWIRRCSVEAAFRIIDRLLFCRNGCTPPPSNAFLEVSGVVLAQKGSTERKREPAREPVDRGYGDWHAGIKPRALCNLSLESCQRQERAFGLLRKVYKKGSELRAQQPELCPRYPVLKPWTEEC
jgi:hypothetical protein